MIKRKLSLDKYYRYVAFVDILGYRSAISDCESDEAALERMRSIYENYVNSFESCFFKDEHDDMLYTEIERIAFSDCIYFSSKTLPPLIDMLQSFFAGVYVWQTNSYLDSEMNWMPYIRAGIDYGWVNKFRDPTVPNAGNAACYRNPVGSGIVNAFCLTEKDVALPGMRIFMRKSLLKHSKMEFKMPMSFKNVRECYLIDVENTDEVAEVLWPLEVINHSNTDFLYMLAKTKRQFMKKGSFKHYNCTVDLFEKATRNCEDSFAVEVWERNQDSIRKFRLEIKQA